MADHPFEFLLYQQLLHTGGIPRRAASLGREGAWIVEWANGDTEAVYQQPDHHTLSVYLQGGQEILCRDEPQARGAPGRMCTLPPGHSSRWLVRGRVRLVHIYLPRLALAEAAEVWFDRDPRTATLRDKIYFEDPVLFALARGMASMDWSTIDAELQLQDCALRVQARLLNEHGGQRRLEPRIRGGLSPVARRAVLELIESSILSAQGREAVSLHALAGVANLSVFHFSRMFKMSFGMPAHAWVLKRRLSYARTQLACSGWSLQEVALRSGFASLDHLNQTFRRAGFGSAGRLREALLK